VLGVLNEQGFVVVGDALQGGFQDGLIERNCGAACGIVYAGGTATYTVFVVDVLEGIDRARAGDYAGAVVSGIVIVAKPVGIAAKSLGANPFKGKSAQQIGDMLENKGYVPKGKDPISGQGTYIIPKTGRGYHIDADHLDPKGPHVGVHRPRGLRDSMKPRDYPLE
jgi:hypothetical protein